MSVDYYDTDHHSFDVDDTPGDSYMWREQHLYGSSRLGMVEPKGAAQPCLQSNQRPGWQRHSRQRVYELPNHLGSDGKIWLKNQTSMSKKERNLNNLITSGMEAQLKDLKSELENLRED